MAARINMKDKFRRMISPTFLESDDDLDGFSFSAASDDIPDIKFSTDCFVAMVGGIYDFYGMDLNGIKLNDMIFQILEDPDDGYRSHLGAVRIYGMDECDYKFFPIPIARVLLSTSDKEVWRKEIDDDFNGYVIIDIKDDHVWALIGTGNTSDYYPFFINRYMAKPPESG